MSIAPNNPFEQRDGWYDDQPPRGGGGNGWLWVMTTIGAVFLLGTLACCVGGYFIVGAGKKMLAEEAAKELQDNPVIEEHIGIIEEIEMDFGEVIAAAKDQDDDDGTVTFVFEVRGSKGSGKILMRQDESEDVARAELVMDDGTRYEIPLDDFDEIVEEDLPTLPIEPVDTELFIEEAESPTGKP